ncbi:MAG: asparagine synthase [Planctomycetaceae bacterium]|nr:MAG: asparagine synthase [Planctomycetaceae bacterium]
MIRTQALQRVVDLTDPSINMILNMTVEEARERVAAGDPLRIREIDGQFGLVGQQGKIVRLARSLGQPLRYFIAKQHDGPLLIVADRIDTIARYLREQGLHDQFHPSYTRMVPAHYVTEIALVGCPDPAPNYRRFFEPMRNRWEADVVQIGRRYVEALATEVERWLERIERHQPIGVLFSGGIDSGAVLLVLYAVLLRRGESPSRLKAFTLSVGGRSPDSEQAWQFLHQLGLEMLWECCEVPPEAIDLDAAIRVIEDYKPWDVQAAAMNLALCREIRRRYPPWLYLVDGDGGDENLKDYPLQDNPELTIRSVLSNPLLYHEGWGVQAIKHSLTYSGGQSRGHVRSYAPAQQCGFRTFSPWALPNVIEVSEGIPFVTLTDWDETKLYELKGKVVRHGVKVVTGLEMPIFPKRRFQEGAVGGNQPRNLFPQHPAEYRRRFERLFAEL